ncbi:MAG TPA: hypothetical protein VFH51_15265 [Myxococcota bacterium]|nr:hypothetical protein [Myxococcota bacterium]
MAQVPGLRRPRDVKYLTGAGGWARYTLGPEGSKRHYREASPPAPGDCVEPLEFGVFPRLSDEQVAILVEDQETQQKLLRTPVLSPLAWGPSRAPGTAVAALPQAAPVAASATLPARRRFGAPTPLLQIKTQDALGMWWQYTLTNDGKKAGLDLATPPSAADYIEPSELHDTDSLTLQQISAVVAAQARRTKPQPEPAIAGSLAAAPTPGVTEEPWLTTALDHPEAWMSDLAGFDDAGQPTDPTRTPKR